MEAHPLSVRRCRASSSARARPVSWCVACSADRDEGGGFEFGAVVGDPRIEN